MIVKNFEKKDDKTAVFTVEADASEFEASVNRAYIKNKSSISVPGFRKGKAPRAVIEGMYGKEVFYQDAMDDLAQPAFDFGVAETKVKYVGRPSLVDINVTDSRTLELSFSVEQYPEVTLGQYKGVEVEKQEASVSEAEVDQKIEQERDKNARMMDIDDRAVLDGDMIKLDFEGFVDGVAFDGGKGEDYPLTIGSGSFIPGFEEQLIGAKIGEEMEVNVTFPEDYQAENLKGKAATFKCTVKSIQVKELPELDDDFAQDVSEFDTLDEYKDDIRAKLLEQKEADLKRAKQNAALDAVVSNAQMEIPDAMVDEQVRRMAEDFSRRIQSQGLTVEQYMQFTGMTAESMLEQFKPEALKRIQNSLVLEAVAKAEDIQISDEAVEAEVKRMAEQYKMAPDALKEALGEYELGQLKNDLAIQAAVELITDAAVEVEPKEEA